MCQFYFDKDIELSNKLRDLACELNDIISTINDLKSEKETDYSFTYLERIEKYCNELKEWVE